MKLGLFGGSFDPVHLGHLLVAQAARAEAGLDRVYFIPAAQSPFKPGAAPAPAARRLQLLRLALAGASHAEIDDQEIRRGGVSYSIDTVRAYQKRFPGATLCYLIGADQTAQLHLWRDAADLARLTEFLIVPRPGETPPALPPNFHGRALRGWPLAVSSSEIRARVKAGAAISHLVPATVEEAIRQNGLYL
jgi:nicotinate-nucleotide adenylyltransferase